MLKNLYVLIIILPLVQIICRTIITDSSMPMESMRKLNFQREAPAGDSDKRGISVSLKHGTSTTSEPKSPQYEKSDPRFFDSVVEQATKPSLSHSTAKKLFIESTPAAVGYESRSPDKSFDDIKALLARVLEQIEAIERNDKEKLHGKSDEIRNADVTGLGSNDKGRKSKKDGMCNLGDMHGGGIKWGHWTDWSSCSVSCGKGRQIRWRHCMENCQDAETEMEEKTCQLPACGPGKLFGMIKI